MDLDINKYRELFFQESREYLNIFFSKLAQISDNEFDTGIINELFRAAHSIKGMAASLEFNDVAQLAHAIENLFDVLKREKRVVDRKYVNDIYQYVKVLEALIDRHQGKEGEEIDLDSILQKINQIITRGDNVEERSEGGIQAPVSQKRLNVIVEIEKDVDAPAVRAYMVLRKAKEFGEVLSSNPSITDLKNGKFNGTLHLVIASKLSPDDIRDALTKMGSVKGVHLSAEEQDTRDQPLKKSRTVRVKGETLDEILAIAGELIVARSQLLTRLKRKLSQEEEDIFANLSSLIDRMKETVLSVRLLPLSFLTDRLPRVVLDASQRTGKDVELIVKGEDVEIDRFVLDALHDPMTHILRNCVDHGIENPDERERNGKKRTGRIEINARRTGESVEIDIIDDGRGMDAEALKKRAVSMGVLTPEEASRMSYADSLYLACVPGLSTRDKATDTSGRGVGMDVVKSVIEAHGGTLLIFSEPGRGTRISLKLPLNISIIRSLILNTGDNCFGIPLSRVERVIEIDMVNYSIRDKLYELDGKMVRVFYLRSIFGPDSGEPRIGILSNVRGKPVLLGVDELVDMLDLYVLKVPEPLSTIKALSGVSILGNGTPIFIIDPYFMEGEWTHELQ